LRKGAGEHVFHCDGSLKELDIPNYSCLCSLHFVMLL
jgi:hypothetical protein